MTLRGTRVVGGLLLLLLPLAACQAEKSANPLSPAIAGPISGVSISAPGLLQPTQGSKFKDTQQPIQLVVQNATTTGVRPLSYTFEVATDAGFSTKVFARTNVAPGDGKTAVQVDMLPIGQSYFWRSRAEDGANTGDFASAAFDIFPKAAVNPPAAIAPVNNAVAASTSPTLTVSDAGIVGPVGPLTYEFQVSSDQAFSHLVSAGIVGEGAGQTAFNSSALTASTTFFWRVRASDGQTTSNWSVVQAFRTPAVVVPPTTPPPPTGKAGSCAGADGPTIISCIAAKYPDKIAPVGSVGERQQNMMFLRDRIIEAGLCGGMNLGWNLKRGGPDLSIDVLAWKRSDGNMGVDIGFDYDDNPIPLKLVWSEVDLNASWTKYTNAFTCGS